MKVNSNKTLQPNAGRNCSCGGSKMKAKNYDLSAKNPNGKSDIERKSSEELLKSIETKEDEIKKIISEMKNII